MVWRFSCGKCAERTANGGGYRWNGSAFGVYFVSRLRLVSGSAFDGEEG
jgi:hypothetical protein